MSKLLTWLEGTVSSGGAVDVEGRGDVLAAGRSSSGVVMVVGGDSLSFLGSAAPPTTGGGLLPSGDTTTESSVVVMVVIHSPWAQLHHQPHLLLLSGDTC